MSTSPLNASPSAPPRPTPKSFVVLHGGARDGYHVPLAIHEGAALAGLVTDFYSKSGLVGNRHCHGLPSAKVHNDWRAVAGMAAFRLRGRMGRPPTFDPRSSWQSMGSLAQSVARRHDAGLISYSRGDSSRAFAGFTGEKVLFLYHPLHRGNVAILRSDADRYGLAPESVAPDTWFDEELLMQAEAEEVSAADSIVCASHFSRSSVPRDELQRKKVVVVPYGCPPPQPATRETRDRDFLFVGQGIQRKGVHHLFAVWPAVRRRCPGATMTMVMSRVDRQLLPGVLPDGMVVLPRATQEELTRLRHRHRVLVLPSLVEGFGLVAGEALSHGMYVIATTSTGFRDIPGAGACGTLISPSDRDGLRSAMIAAAQSEHDPDASYAAAAGWQWADFRQRLRLSLHLDGS